MRYQSKVLHVQGKVSSHDALEMHLLPVVCLLVHAIATVFQLYHVSDMTYEMRRKSEPTLVLTEGIF